MRLFLAINFPEDVKNALSSGMTALARRGVRANWSRRENLHLTLEFLGRYGTPRRWWRRWSG